MHRNGRQKIVREQLIRAKLGKKLETQPDRAFYINFGY